MLTQANTTQFACHSGAFTPFMKPLSSILSSSSISPSSALVPDNEAMLASILNQLIKDTKNSQAISEVEERAACSTDHSHDISS